MKGEQKSMKQAELLLRAPTASVQKTPIAASPPPKKKGGLRGKIAESKKEELTDTMKQAVALVKTYVPPNPAMIQRAVDAGKVSIEVVQPGKVVRLVFKDYELPGDSLAITMDLTTNHLTGDLGRDLPREPVQARDHERDHGEPARRRDLHGRARSSPCPPRSSWSTWPTRGYRKM